ncbi:MULTISPECIES: hypothetical protein [unclassified Beijerinckia]|uniref:hypothetical protein n=1 Tax=unclassified Beijerinckia TaxID=2638183 RepID=UPI0008956C24|nr:MULTISPECIES: hypothetical protein [unclassified Beijerinckia]MDH7797491.1 hypothetical protein [Beijerinckia sp. GAS462]SEC87771.1 hypothetical protein SAMN05443249_3786 [Beijerinckia sp. 28-YEA-48]
MAKSARKTPRSSCLEAAVCDMPRMAHLMMQISTSRDKADLEALCLLIEIFHERAAEIVELYYRERS